MTQRREHCSAAAALAIRVLAFFTVWPCTSAAAPL